MANFEVGKTYKRIIEHPSLEGQPDPTQCTREDKAFLCEGISPHGNPLTSQATYKGAPSSRSFLGLWSVGDANELELGRFVEVSDV